MERRREFYEKWCNVGGINEERVRVCIEVLRDIKGARFLDIGCADGAITVTLARVIEAEEVCGIDIASKAVAVAREKGVNAICCDIDREDLPFEDEWFDVAYCGELIEHVFDSDHLLSEVRRVLKREGFCLMTTPNLAGWPNRLALLLGYQPYPTAASPHHEGIGKFLLQGEEGQWGHIRVLTLRALRELVDLYGFSIIKLRGCPVTVNSKHWICPLVKGLDRLLARFPSLANRLVLLLRKG